MSDEKIDHAALIAEARAIVERDFTHPRYNRGEAVQLHSILNALEAVQQAPAVDKEALVRYFYMDNAGWEESAVEHWNYLIDRIRKGIETGHDNWLCFQAADRLIASGILQDAAEERRLEANVIANLIAKEAHPGMEINHDGTENRETAAYVEGIRVAHGVALDRAQQVREGN